MIKNHDELHEECGVVAIWGDDNAAQLTYLWLTFFTTSWTGGCRYCCPQ